MTTDSASFLTTLYNEYLSPLASACWGRLNKNTFDASRSVPCPSCRFPNAWFDRGQVCTSIGQVVNGRLLPAKKTSGFNGEDSCPGCQIAEACFELVKAEKGIDDKDGDLVLSLYAPTKSVRINVYTSRSQRTDFERVLDVFTLPHQPRLQPLKVASVPSANLRWSRITHWLDHCTRKHKECSRQDSFIPSRLLYLDGSDPAYIKLVERNDRELDFARYGSGTVKYACLSYVWGQTRSRYQTTLQQIAANKQSIPLKDLELTFRDAVECARRLGIAFLWIDSFCIVQGDENDWSYESAQMASVYKNAFVTIGAGVAKDSSEGFLTQSAGSGQTQLLRRNITFLDKSYDVHLRMNMGHWHWEEQGALPLTTRAWTLQEQLLSRRFLLFTHGEVIMECREGVTCECTLADTPFLKDSVEVGSFKSRPSRTGFHQLSNMKNSQHQMNQQWWKIVRMYMSRGLTKPQDKLPALSALACEFQHRLGDDYVAGHWRSTLASTLTWSISHKVEKLPASRPRKAPSWSWISAPDGPIEISEIPRTSLVDIISTQLAIDPRTPAGEVQKGVLTVYGHMIPIASIRRHRPQQPISSDGVTGAKGPHSSIKSIGSQFAPDVIFHGLRPSRAQLLPDYDFDVNGDYDETDDPKMAFLLCHTEVDGACWVGLLLRKIMPGLEEEEEEAPEVPWHKQGAEELGEKPTTRQPAPRRVAVYERLGKMTIVLRPGEKCIHPKEHVCIM